MEIWRTITVAAGLLPFVFFLSIALLRATQGAGNSRAIVDAFLAWTAVSFLSAELFGLFYSISFFPIFGTWIVLIGLAIAQLWKMRSRLRFDLHISNDLTMLIVAIFVLTTLFIALSAEPNNWDSQTYHLPRIEHWIQNGSIEHYPTAMAIQNAAGPLAEIMILHVRVLTGSDIFDLLIQWTSMLCALFAVFQITRQLSGTITQSWVAVVFVATLPMGILQSTSTQNDYVTAALLCCFVTLGLQTLIDAKPRLPIGLETMAAGALCGIVKPTGYLIGAGFAIWYVVSIARRLSLRSLLGWGAAAAIILATIAGPFSARNLSTYGSIQSPVAAVTNNEIFGIKQTLDNLILNTAVNLASGDPETDSVTTKVTLKLTSFLGLDKKRAQTTLLGTEFKMPERQFINHEDFGPNSIHTVLILLAVALTLLTWRRSLKFPAVLFYWCAWFGGVVLFAAILKWQIYGVRLQLPFYVLAGPAVAMASDPHCRQHGLQFITLLTVLVYGGLSALLFNASRPLVPFGNKPSYLRQPPLQRLFANYPTLLEPYVIAMGLLAEAKAKKIALVSDDWEYPTWRILRDRKIGYPIRIEHIQVAIGPDQKPQFQPPRPGTLTWPLGPFVPDAVIWVRIWPRSDVPLPERVEVAGQDLVRRGPPGPVNVFTKNP